MKTLFIVGGSSGIGYATAKKFLSEGYEVINMSRTPCDLPSVTNLECNVTERSVLDKHLEELKEKSIDAFVYSAGFSMASPLEFVAEGDYRYLYEVNLFAFMHILRTLLPTLEKTSAKVCVVSSLASFAPIPFDAYYTSSKCAVNGAITALRQELAESGVTLFAALPGGVKTDFTSKRKVYPPAAVDGYAQKMTLATDNLRDMEQNGSSPTKVADFIYKKMQKEKLFSALYPVAFPDKIVFFLLRLLPQILIEKLINNVFFTSDTEA